jgi:putative DNA primase/helicase
MTTTRINISHDGSFDIATGRSRREIKWKNQEMLWSELIKKLSITHRTAETYDEYMASKKLRQDEIKDIGGFVGGYLNNGRRKNGNVVHRQLVTLDIDFAPENFWEDFSMLYDCAAVMYSTHKHSAEAPRLRLIIPLDRPVFVDEYTAVARRIAGSMGIDHFDHTTFQPVRLMYWPSTSKDGDYLFHYQDGPWLCADDVLKTYHNWKDSSEWPVSSREGTIIEKQIQKQGDPLEKSGIVGAFCRTYTVQEAIEVFLSDVYEACDQEDRYTYKEGSTAAGLVVYEDKYVYSHHGTDPISGKLCNAFDLVRLHKFGLKDEDAREDTPSNRLPSFIAMIELATKDAQVRKLIVSEKLSDAQGDFTDLGTVDDEEVDDKWKEKMDVDRKGNAYSTIDNIVLILENDPYLKNRIAYDDFEKCEVAIQDLSWRKVNELTRRLTDKDDANIRHYLEKTYGISSIAKTKDAMEVLALKKSFHPVREYLNSNKWDGENRLETLFVDYQGAMDNEYTRTTTRKMLVAAVARVFDPGVKFDHVLVLVGKQGLKKSTIISKLGRQWFTDSFSTIEGKESFEQLQGVWLVEIAELAGLAKAEVEKIKHFITKRDDRYRVAFGRRTEKFPRQCVFFATTNKRDFLRDPTGDRRYWPVLVNEIPPTKDVFNDLDDYEVGQIWAEAVYHYRKGEALYLPGHIANIATLIQKDHTEEHPWTGLIARYLDIKLPPDWDKLSVYERRAFLHDEDELQAKGSKLRTRVCLLELWSEALDRREAIDERSATAIRNIMLNLEGWESTSKPMRFGFYGVQRKGYIRSQFPPGFIESEDEKGCYNDVTRPLQSVTN